MNLFFAFAIIAAIVPTVVYGAATDPWTDYKTKHGKKYSANEDAQRKKLFLATDATITKHNSQKNPTFRMAHNIFSVMTPAELKQFLGAVNPVNKTRSSESTITIDMADRALPASLDYRTSPCLSPVKNQGPCGCCWAFSAIAPLEFAQCKKYGSLVTLSEQQLVDCDPYDQGCSGGWHNNAWNYLKNVAGGSAKQSLYPYTATNINNCTFSSSMIGAKISSYGSLATPNATNMQAALQLYGPLSVAIAVTNSFYQYWSGVYTDTTCDNVGINHGVVVVGYGTLNGINHWIIRNSWGSMWGSNGYMLMQRGVNKCKIESYPAVVAAVV